MTSQASDSTDSPQRSLLARLALASGVGTALEFYDFALYATATSLVFTKVFFVVPDPWFGDFLGFVTFAVGFLMAPIGAIVFGHLGDRIGRRRTLVLTFSLMGGATIIMGLLPDYRSIGIAAPLLLLALRLVHGLSRGGEVGGAALLAIEHAPEGRKGLYGSFVALGSPVGAGLATLAFMLVLLMPADAVVAWGWRIPFLIGGLVLAVGLLARLQVDETPVFRELQRTRSVSRLPVVDMLRTNWRRVLLTGGVMFGFNAFQYVLFTFMLAFGTQPTDQHGLGLPRQPLVAAVLIGCLVHAVVILAVSMLSDRVGRKPIIVVGACAMAVYSFPMFWLFQTGVAGAMASIVIGFLIAGVMFGPMLTFFSELFPAAQRYSAVGLGFQLGAALGGGFAPLIANRLVAETGTTVSISWYLFGALMLSLLSLAALRRRNGVSAED